MLEKTLNNIIAVPYFREHSMTFTRRHNQGDSCQELAANAAAVSVALRETLRREGVDMWCIYRLYFCRRPGCSICGAGDDYHSEFVETTTSPQAGDDRIRELRQQHPLASYSVHWVYGSQIATTN